MSETQVEQTAPNDGDKSFVHLHLHTQYSLLDGAIKIKDLMVKTKEFGMPAVAQTDHGNMFGAIDFYTSCKKAGIKPIIGSEVYFTPGSRFDRIPPTRRSDVLDSQDAEESKHQIHHLILLCKNETGYKNLCKLVSYAYLEGFYYKPRIDFELLNKYSEGLICSTACLKGEVAYNFFTGQDEKAIAAINKLHGIFGDDLYIEIQENGIMEQTVANEKLVKYARENDLKLVATNDCHYLTPDDAAAQEVLLCVQTGKTFADEKRMRLTTNEFYFKSAKIMREKFHYAPDACDNTLEIADKCNLELNWTKEDGSPDYLLPDFEIDTGESSAEFFTRMSREGLEERFLGPHFRKLILEDNWESEQKPVYYKRLEEELKMIIDMDFPGYFLIVSDFIKWSKDHDIPVGPGRGSGAGSIVAYSLKITDINPIPFNLLFERFINPERISMPDFDIDFCQDRRQEVIEYVTKKYGEDKVAQIVTFGQLKTKAVLKDVARVYDLSFAESNALTKLVPDELGIGLQDAIDKEPKLQELIESDPKIRQIVNISKRLENLNRHAGIHAAGVVITDEPLLNYCPLFKGKNGEQVVQYDKNFAELIGLVKFDFLGLKTLSVIKQVEGFIKRDHDESFNIENIDLEDKAVYEFISTGSTLGIFQLESSGMIDLCKRIKPGTLDDVTAINALYRPGPLESGMVDDFIEIKQGSKEMTFAFPELEPVLKDTYGVIVYQEQVMNIARIIGGYSLGGADMLRRAMGKKKVEEMDRHRGIFLKGAQERNFDTDKAGKLYDLMANFAAYGFNKSHAVAYALIAYQTAFLKKYYRPEFFAGILSYELDNKEKITAYIKDAGNNDIEVMAPDVNESLWLFNVVNGNIRFGMGAIKNVGKVAVESLIKERDTNGPFLGFVNFCERVNLRDVNKRTMEALIKVGAFDSCDGHNRKTLLENVENIALYAAKVQEEKELGQVNLFGGAENAEQMSVDIIETGDFDDKTKLGYEAELMGIYISGHPLDQYKDAMEDLSSMPINEVLEAPGSDEREMTLCGLLTDVKEIVTRKGKKMAFANLEDLTGKIECIIFPKSYEDLAEKLHITEPIIVRGAVKLSESPRKLFLNKILDLKEEAKESVTAVRIDLDYANLNGRRLDKLKQTILSYRGSIPLYLIFDNGKARARLPLGDEFLVHPSPQLASRINEIFQANCVKYIIDGKAEGVYEN